MGLQRVDVGVVRREEGGRNCGNETRWYGGLR